MQGLVLTGQQYVFFCAPGGTCVLHENILHSSKLWVFCSLAILIILVTTHSADYLPCILIPRGCNPCNQHQESWLWPEQISEPECLLQN